MSATRPPNGTSPRRGSTPKLLMIETDHDLRNPTDMILLERVAKAVFHTDGIAQVQSITRPLGTPLDHTSIPFQISAQSAGQIQNLPLPAGPRRRPAQAGRRDRQHPSTSCGSSTRCNSRPAPPPTNRVEAFQETVADRTGPARQDRQLRRLLPAAAQLLLLGATLFRHPDLRGAALGVRLPRRHRRADRPARPTSRRAWTSSTRSSRNCSR